MDIISNGLASKMAQAEKNTRNNVLGSGIEGTFPHTRERIDAIENAIQKVNAQANQLIVNDAINIMKAHAKFNSVAKSVKYKMQNMIFDDLLDLSGIDTMKSTGYTHDAVNGLLTAGTNCVIETKEEVADAVPSKVILTVEESLNIQGTNLIPAMGSNSSPSGLVEASGYLAGNESFKAFDRSRNTWITSSNTGWISYTFSTPQKINSYSLASDAGYSVASDRMPKNWTFEAWNGATWIVLDTQTNITSWIDRVKKIFSFSNENSYTKYRINITANNGNIYVGIGEIEMMYSVNLTEIKGIYSISRNDGLTWESITPNTLFYFTDSVSPLDNQLRIKVELSSGTQLLNYSLTWA